MRKQLDDNFKKRFGIEVELLAARGSAGVRRVADEVRSGVRHFDSPIGGSSSVGSGMLDGAILDAIELWLVLPEIKNAQASAEKLD